MRFVGKYKFKCNSERFSRQCRIIICPDEISIRREKKKKKRRKKNSPGSHPSSCYLYCHDFFGTRPCLDRSLSVCFTGNDFGFLQDRFLLVTLIRLRSPKCWNQEWMSVRVVLFVWFGFFPPCKLLLLFTFWLSCLINLLL